MTEDDSTLLHNFAARRSETAFAELVRRHLALVYSTALRQVNGDVHLAEDVTQLVFTDLARKAGRLGHHPALVGWLHTSARYAATKLVRTEARRRNREQESMSMQKLNLAENEMQSDWEKVRPILDDVLGEMNERDREVILLRLLEGRDYAAVGARLALTDNAARMRTERALEKLRTLLARRGITSSSSALTAALTTHAVTAAPAGMAATVVATAMSGAAMTGGGGVGAIFMSMTKLQIGLTAGIIATGTGGLVWQEWTGSALRSELVELRRTAATPVEPPAAGANRESHPTAVAVGTRTDAELARLETEAEQVRAALHAREREVRRPASGPVLTLDQVDRKPKAASYKQPQYPDAMRQAGIEGNVIVSFVINEIGEVEDARVVSASRSEFAPSVLEAVAKWRFDPAEKNGSKVRTRVEQLLTFKIAGKELAPAAWF